MKYFFSAVITFFIISMASGQVTLTASDVPVVGDVIYQATDASVNGNFYAIPEGENVVWDFSSLSTSSVDTLTYVEPSNVDVNNDFPAANLASISHDTSFFFSNSESFAWAGKFYNGIVLKPDEPFLLFVFPFTYSSTLCDTLHLSVTVPYDTTINGLHVDSARFSLTNIENDTAIAYGTVILPNEVIDSALMIKRTSDRHEVTSAHTTFGWIDVKDTTYTEIAYNAFVNGYHGFVINLKMNDDGSVKKAEYKFTEITNQSECWVNKTSIYPVPAKNMLHVSSLEPIEEVCVFDVAGKLLMKKECHNKEAALDISSFCKGAYMLKIKTSQGFVVKRFEKID